jgi:hypothetical protein
VTADFSRVRIEAAGEDRVRVSGATGTRRPACLKVTVGFDAGFLAEAGISYAGPGAGARGRLAADIIEERLRTIHRFEGPMRIDVIGLASLFATAIEPAPQSEDVRVHAALRSASRAMAETLLWEVEALLCCGPAGGGGFRGSITPSVVTKSVLIAREHAKPSIEVLVA